MVAPVLIRGGFIYSGRASSSFLDVFGLFDDPEAHATPLGYGHDFGLVVFDLGFGLEFGFERGKQSAETASDSPSRTRESARRP
jgi:hypothetical protein